MPVTVRIPSFGGIGAVEHHSESTESYWAHTAGLKVVVPSTPSDAYWLLRHSIACPDPVMFLEPKRRYWGRDVVDTTVPGPPIGQAAVRRAGTDVTVLTYGGLVGTALSTAEIAAQQHGWSLEVIDLRSLVPWISTRWPRRSGAPGGAWCCMRDREAWGTGRGWRPASRKRCSTNSRHRCCGPADSTPRTRRHAWRSCGCPARIGCWTASNARWRHRESARRRPRQSVPRPRSRRGTRRGDADPLARRCRR